MYRRIRSLVPTVASVLALALFGSGCVASSSASSAGTSRAAYIDAEGGYVRHLRVRTAPADTKAFEAVLAECAEAATEASAPLQWLAYREPPGRYWLLWFSDAPSFSIPDGEDPVATFVEFVAGRADPRRGRRALAQLSRIEYELEWNTVHRSRAAWRTSQEMIPDVHPIARMMVRTVRPGMERSFADALAARTAFFEEQHYPLPVEGFVTLSGNPGTAMQVVFGFDWPTFYSDLSFGAFVKALDEDAQADYARRKDALMRTMSRAEYYDATLVPELCFGGR